MSPNLSSCLRTPSSKRETPRRRGPRCRFEGLGEMVLQRQSPTYMALQRENYHIAVVVWCLFRGWFNVLFFWFSLCWLSRDSSTILETYFSFSRRLITQMEVHQAPNGCVCVSKLNHQGTAGFSPWFHLPGFHVGYPSLTHRQIASPSISSFGAGETGAHADLGRGSTTPPSRGSLP